MYRRTGKEVLRDNEHVADAVSEEAAELIVQALNNFDHPLIHPDLAQPERESDYDWDASDPVDPYSHAGVAVATHEERHVIARQSDEYACSCGTRWPVDEGDDHP